MTTQNKNQAYNTIFIHNKRMKERQEQTLNDLEEIEKLQKEVNKKLSNTKMRLSVSKAKTKEDDNN